MQCIYCHKEMYIVFRTDRQLLYRCVCGYEELWDDELDPGRLGVHCESKDTA